jgi:hypothetical protein
MQPLPMPKVRARDLRAVIFAGQRGHVVSRFGKSVEVQLLDGTRVAGATEESLRHGDYVQFDLSTDPASHLRAALRVTKLALA